MAPAPRITTTWSRDVGAISITITAATARIHAGMSTMIVRAMTKTACATIATAASFNPSTQPAVAKSTFVLNRANAVRASADGSVNPSHAASPPR